MASKIEDYLLLRQKRAELEDLAAKIKEQETRIKQELLMSMDALGVDAYKQDGYTVSRRTTQHVEVSDPVVFYDVNFDQMAQARKRGSIASDGMLLTKRVSTTNVLALVRERLKLPPKAELDINNPDVQYQLKAVGVRVVLTPDISIRKSN